MFDISFGELLVIFIMALLVVGPQKLPDLFVSLIRQINKFKQMAQNLRQEVESELDLQSLKKEIYNVHQEVEQLSRQQMSAMKALQNEITADAKEVTGAVQSNLNDIQKLTRQTHLAIATTETTAIDDFADYYATPSIASPARLAQADLASVLASRQMTLNTKAYTQSALVGMPFKPALDEHECMQCYFERQYEINAGDSDIDMQDDNLDCENE